MKIVLLTIFFSLILIALKAQKDTTKSQYLVKYEVLTKKGSQVNVGYFDKDGKNAGAIAAEQWSYSFTTTDKYQNIQLSTQRMQSGIKKVWAKVNIYVNDKLIKSSEDKFMGVGPSIQVNLQMIN